MLSQIKQVHEHAISYPTLFNFDNASVLTMPNMRKFVVETVVSGRPGNRFHHGNKQLLSADEFRNFVSGLIRKMRDAGRTDVEILAAVHPA